MTLLMHYQGQNSCVRYNYIQVYLFVLSSHRVALSAINYRQSFNLLDRRWGQPYINMKLPSLSRQPKRVPWTMERLLSERALALSSSLDKSTHISYSSALNSWIAFVNMHHFDFEPTADTLSFFVVYMSHQINPQSVKTYPSGLVSELERDFHDISEIRKTKLVKKTMTGCLKLLAKPIHRKDPLYINNLTYFQKCFQHSTNHDDLLFFTLLATGFHGLHRLGDLTFPDDPAKWEWRKVSRRSSVVLQQPHYSFLLNAHKADKTFEGNTVLIQAFEDSFDPFPFFSCYLSSQDNLFPASSPLWLTSTGNVPTRSFSCLVFAFSSQNRMEVPQ